MKYISGIYGLLKGVIEAMLVFMHNLTGNFGLAIIGVTILMKIILLPLTLKQDKSMKSMKKLQPELDKLKEKYKGDPKMLNQKTMELYQQHKVNPAGGCLPLLVQLPILWALFGVLRGGIVPQDSTFLWMELVKPDPFYILPVLNGVVSFVQQKVMGSSDNPQMKNMMYMFPIMMVFISYKMPAGLQIYWLTSSLAGVIQQYLIMKRGE
ncbi:YidC/Oxa1 family membrane protein insertase [Fusobacterium ulcerans]|jgi:YidC/Oxa1 family membrane protein insertase